MMRRKKNARLEILGGWKEIANYLRKGVRSVQRYERELGLPIHRPAMKSPASVVAIKAELDRWLTSSPVRTGLRPKRQASRTHRLGAKFLQIDCEIALTFCSIALGTKDAERKRRATQTARKAYDTILRLRKNINLEEVERDKLDACLQRLKAELQSIGESF